MTQCRKYDCISARQRDISAARQVSLYGCVCVCVWGFQKKANLEQADRDGNTALGLAMEASHER